MSEVPSELKYTQSHEWVRDEGDGIFSIGITDHAQEQLGDLVYVELPEVGASLNAGEDCAVIESVKAASDLYTPLTGEVIAINNELDDTPETINENPYGDGWVFKLKASDTDEVNQLLDSASYLQHCENEAH